MNAIVATLIDLVTSAEVCPYARNLELRKRVEKAEELDDNILLDNAVLLTMYQNLDTRKYVRDLLHIVLGYVFDGNEEFAQKKTSFNTKLETTLDNAPPLVIQLFDDIAMADKKGKNLLYYAIKEGDVSTVDIILRCRGFNAAM